MNKTHYQNRVADLEQSIISLKKSINRLSLIRLVVFLSAFISFYFVFALSTIVAFILLVAFIIIFILVLRNQTRLSKRAADQNTLILIFKNELGLQKNEPNLFGDGAEYVDGRHPFSGDLDIFGKHSIFSLINRSLSYEGKNTIAEWLSTLNSPIEEIKKRQISIQELAEMEQFKEEMLVESIHLKNEKIDQQSILKWFDGFEFSFLRIAPYSMLMNIMSVVFVLLIPLSFVYDHVYLFLILAMLLSTFFNFFFFRRINLLHGKISKQGEIFHNYSQLVDIISKQAFSTEKLQNLKNELAKPEQIIRELKKLSRLIEQLDYRLNVYVAFFLNALFFWDIQKCIQIEKWLVKNHDRVPEWLAPIAEIDALLSLSIFKFNHPGFSFPEFNDTNEIFFEAKELGHPLIPEENRICNNYMLDGMGNFDLITGSNMAGKTTFLRTVGINAVLAMAGCPVCAHKLSLSNFKIMTYMRIADSLEYNLSTFHAEIQRIRDILDFVKENRPNLLLLDELLRGTNSRDRARGTRALILTLLEEKASGLISTHDLGLTEMEKEFPDAIRNFHFDIVNKDDDLDFDYKLKEGVSRTTNAAMLLKKIGLRLDQY